LLLFLQLELALEYDHVASTRDNYLGVRGPTTASVLKCDLVSFPNSRFSTLFSSFTMVWNKASSVGLLGGRDSAGTEETSLMQSSLQP
jgi:hypothetical protein